MLAAPLLVGMIAGGWSWTHVPLTAFWFAGYFAFFAVSLWLKSRRRARFLRPVQVYGVAAIALGIVVILVRPDLLVWAPAFAVPLGVGLAAAAARRERDLLVGLTMVVASCLMTVVAVDAGLGEVGGAGGADDLSRAWLLAAVQAAYFAGTVFYVKSAIRERGNRGFLALSVAFHVAATAAMLPFGWPLVVVFAVLSVRAALVPGLRLSPKVIGIGEILATAAVVAVALLTV